MLSSSVIQPTPVNGVVTEAVLSMAAQPEGCKDTSVSSCPKVQFASSDILV